MLASEERRKHKSSSARRRGRARAGKWWDGEDDGAGDARLRAGDSKLGDSKLGVAAREGWCGSALALRGRGEAQREEW